MDAAAPMPLARSTPTTPRAFTGAAWTTIHEALLDPFTGHVALFVIAASFVFPFEGLGIELCLFHASTGLPCHGCGLTRAFVSIASGDFSSALALHPFALVAYPLFLVLGGRVLLPTRAQVAVQAWMLRRQRALTGFYAYGFWAFVGFGFARLGLCFALGEGF